MDVTKILNNEPVTSTLIVADGMKIKHRAIMELFDKYENDLKELGIFTVETENTDRTEKKGRYTRFAWITEDQAYFLVTLMRNSETVTKFKKELVKSFRRTRNTLARILSQQSNADWLEKRAQGKLDRHHQRVRGILPRAGKRPRRKVFYHAFEDGEPGAVSCRR
jgi:phage regulator Rha-like protein